MLSPGAMANPPDRLMDFIHLTAVVALLLIKEGPKKILNLMLLTEEFSNIGWMVIG